MQKIETVLELFIKNEIENTDNRIVAINTFVATLKSELMLLGLNDPIDKAQRVVILKLFKNMLSTYETEITQLKEKRVKMTAHLDEIRSLSVHLQPNQQYSSLGIN